MQLGKVGGVNHLQLMQKPIKDLIGLSDVVSTAVCWIKRRCPNARKSWDLAAARSDERQPR